MNDLQVYTRPLNPTLYNALKACFGSVVIANEGAGMYGCNMPHPFLPGRFDYAVTSWGEYYRVNCPFCKDTRRRLWINHLYAQANRNTGWPDSWLAVCYNDNCTTHPARRQQLERQIFGFRNWNERNRPMVIEPGENFSGPILAAEPPGEILRLTELPANHEARRYVINRGYDPDWLYENFKVGYVLSVNDHRYAAARGRLYLPVFFESALVGWQTRLLWDPPKGGPPKYFTMPGLPRRRIVYNYNIAKQWPFVVVVEGLPSVWRIGGPAVALFGKTMTQGQQILLQQAWAGKPIILLLDPDARDEMEGIIGELKNAGRQPIIPVFLPAGFDPADYAHETGVNMIRAAAAESGINLPPW